MPYRITIEALTTATVTQRGERTVVDERPFTDEEVSEACAGWVPSSAAPLKKVYGYAPDAPVTSTKELTIFEQTTQTLDLAAVIKAVNAL